MVLALKCLAALLVFGALVAAALGKFGAAGKRVADRCSAQIVRDVAGLLVRDDWRQALDCRLATFGVGSITCALNAIASSGQTDTATVGDQAVISAVSARMLRQPFPDTAPDVRGRAATYLAELARK